MFIERKVYWAVKGKLYWADGRHGFCQVDFLNPGNDFHGGKHSCVY